jgi:FMN phosphatase YigB (HAD superfamily)
VFVEKKSQPLFSRLLPRNKAARARCTVIGDRVRKEIALGKALGCRTIWVKQGKFSDEGPRHSGEAPDITVRRLAAILAAME